MVGKLFIDGLDAFSEYGIFVEQYGYKALVQMPSFKKLNSTEWPEYDGEETDLSNPILDSKTFSIPFCITDILSASDLFEVLSDGAYHIFDFAELGKSYKLRLLTNPALSAKIQLGKITLNFADGHREPERVQYAAESSSLCNSPDGLQAKRLRDG